MAVWQETFDDLRVKSLQTEIGELKRFEQIYEQLNPGVRAEWEKLFKKLSKTSDEKTFLELSNRLADSDYYKSVRHSIDRAESFLYCLICLKKFKFSRN